MKRILMVVVAGIGCFASADDKSFMMAYDNKDFDLAARQLIDSDLLKPGIARRAGAMYYNGTGVAQDKARGRMLLEQAMLGGEPKAAINLTKIYFDVDKDRPKAAWCLMVAEHSGDESVQSDVNRLRGILGEGYKKDAITYIQELNKSLTAQVVSAENALKEQQPLHNQELKERESLHDQKLLKLSKDHSEALKKLNDQLVAVQTEKNRLESEKEDLEDRLAQSDKRLVALQAEKNLLESEKDDLESSYGREKSDKADLEKKLRDVCNNHQRFIRDLEADSLPGNVQTEKISSSQIYNRYNQLIERHNKLVQKYNKLLRASSHELDCQGDSN